MSITCEVQTGISDKTVCDLQKEAASDPKTTARPAACDHFCGERERERGVGSSVFMERSRGSSGSWLGSVKLGTAWTQHRSSSQSGLLVFRGNEQACRGASWLDGGGEHLAAVEFGQPDPGTRPGTGRGL
ncbi:hypothetical protein WMY93_033319 [Mugilogobius chulae]|uniref:Uncharacterized protein n=1 Tax=Mugilogobius chulae TaxID=88201 RepID=A0AAW0MP77_9GOBI